MGLVSIVMEFSVFGALFVFVSEVTLYGWNSYLWVKVCSIVKLCGQVLAAHREFLRLQDWFGKTHWIFVSVPVFMLKQFCQVEVNVSQLSEAYYNVIVILTFTRQIITDLLCSKSRSSTLGRLPAGRYLPICLLKIGKCKSTFHVSPRLVQCCPAHHWLFWVGICVDL